MPRISVNGADLYYEDTGAGHTSSVEEPAEVNAAIEAFLAGLHA